MVRSHRGVIIATREFALMLGGRMRCGGAEGNDDGTKSSEYSTLVRVGLKPSSSHVSESEDWGSFCQN